jgi:hypothetical protein
VTIKPGLDAPPPLDLMKRWIGESCRVYADAKKSTARKTVAKKNVAAKNK